MSPDFANGKVIEKMEVGRQHVYITCTDETLISINLREHSQDLSVCALVNGELNAVDAPYRIHFRYQCTDNTDVSEMTLDEIKYEIENLYYVMPFSDDIDTLAQQWCKLRCFEFIKVE